MSLKNNLLFSVKIYTGFQKNIFMLRLRNNKQLRQRNSMITISLIRPLSGLFICILVFFLICSYTSGETEYTIYFYNPESNMDNFAAVKTRLDTYLSRFGPYRFQPFADRKTFEKIIRKKRNGILILSSWHYGILKEKFAVSPVLVGMINGKTTQKKVLYAKKSINTLEKLRQMSVSSAGSEEYTRNFLRLTIDDSIVDSLRVLNVPKDIDALISVGLGVAQAALTSEYSIAMLSSIYPKLGKELIPIARGPESLLSIVAMPEKYEPEVSRLPAVIEEMEKHEEGREILHIMGLDGWKKPGAEEFELLEKRRQKL